jgi:hypothetical protein
MPRTRRGPEELVPRELPLEELMRRHPEGWARVGEALTRALATGRAGEVAGLVRRLHAEADAWRARIARSGGNDQVVKGAMAHLAAERLAVLAVERTALSAAVGQEEGTYRLSLWSGTIVQRLLFARGLTRKPVSLRAFRLAWPLVRQRRLVMPLVQQKGIYCFYSRELVAALARLVGPRPCVELAAGDGTLSRFLRAAGVEITATDDQSWGHVVTYPADVLRLEARRALAELSPRAVICSWPPPGNEFERRIFATPSIELYVAIGSRHRFATGDRAAYDQPGSFEGAPDEQLSRLVLPPELDPAVLVFRRRDARP